MRLNVSGDYGLISTTGWSVHAIKNIKLIVEYDHFE